MKTVLIKVPVIMSYQEPNDTIDKIHNLRKWCYTNTKSPWSTFHIRGIDDPEAGDSRVGFVAFEFINEKEAMKFQLYVGK